MKKFYHYLYVYYYVGIDWLFLIYFCVTTLFRLLDLKYSIFLIELFFLITGLWVGSKISLFLYNYKDKKNIYSSKISNYPRRLTQKMRLTLYLKIANALGITNMIGWFFFESYLPLFLKNGFSLSIIVILTIILNLIIYKNDKE